MECSEDQIDVIKEKQTTCHYNLFIWKTKRENKYRGNY